MATDRSPQKTFEILRGSIRIPAEVRLHLKAGHKNAKEPENQSIRNGTQASLLHFEPVKPFLDDLKAELGRMLRRNVEYTGVWTISMKQGGYHVEHIHPKGWRSGVCYIEVPDSASGFLRLGFNMERIIVPQAGNIVVFPSWLPHGTTEYRGEKHRLTIAFDLKEAHAPEIPVVG